MSQDGERLVSATPAGQLLRSGDVLTDVDPHDERNTTSADVNARSGKRANRKGDVAGE